MGPSPQLSQAPLSADEEPFLIFANRYYLRKLNLDGSNYTLLKQVPAPASALPLTRAQSAVLPRGRGRPSSRAAPAARSCLLRPVPHAGPEQRRCLRLRLPRADDLLDGRDHSGQHDPQDAPQWQRRAGAARSTPQLPSGVQRSSTPGPLPGGRSLFHGRCPFSPRTYPSDLLPLPAEPSVTLPGLPLPLRHTQRQVWEVPLALSLILSETPLVSGLPDACAPRPLPWGA